MTCILLYLLCLIWSASDAATTYSLRSLRQAQRSGQEVVLFGDGTVAPDNPVLSAIVERWEQESIPGKRTDGHKIGLAIEGGGMRGAVSAGATAALHYLGLAESIDCVYGSSAGSMIGAYFVSRQFGGIGVYHNILPAAGRSFINKRKLVTTLGVPNRFASNNVFNLDFLLYKVMAESQKFDYDTFARNDAVQPLHITTSRLDPIQVQVLSREQGNFYDLPSLLECIRASMLVPGVTGPLMALPLNASTPVLIPYPSRKDAKRLAAPAPDLLGDALMTEPIPYRSAVSGGCSHVLVLRTRPDPSPTVLRGKGNVYENTIARRCLQRYGHGEAAAFMIRQGHVFTYAQDLLVVNEGCASRADSIGVDMSEVLPPRSLSGVTQERRAHLLAVAPSEGCAEVGQLETGRKEVLTGMRDGALRVLEIFGPAMGIDDAHWPAMLENILPWEESMRRATTYSGFCMTETLQVGNAYHPVEKVEEYRHIGNGMLRGIRDGVSLRRVGKIMGSVVAAPRLVVRGFGSALGGITGAVSAVTYSVSRVPVNLRVGAGEGIRGILGFKFMRKQDGGSTLAPGDAAGVLAVGEMSGENMVDDTRDVLSHPGRVDT